MRSRRGFAFTAEAVLAIFAALALVLILPSAVSPPPSQNLYAYQLAQDLLEVGVKSRPTEIIDFAEGNAIAKASLQLSYEKMVSKLGRYCIVLRARDNELFAGCDERNAADFRRQVVGYRTLIDSQGKWFKLEAFLKY